jgi:hypothetical protein
MQQFYLPFFFLNVLTAARLHVGSETSEEEDGSTLVQAVRRLILRAKCPKTNQVTRSKQMSIPGKQLAPYFSQTISA